MLRIRFARPTSAVCNSSCEQEMDGVSGKLHQQAEVCISSSGSVTGPQPRFSCVSNLIFLNSVTMELSNTSPRARVSLPLGRDSNSSSTFRLVERFASV